MLQSHYCCDAGARLWLFTLCLVVLMSAVVQSSQQVKLLAQQGASALNSQLPSQLLLQWCAQKRTQANGGSERDFRVPPCETWIVSGCYQMSSAWEDEDVQLQGPLTWRQIFGDLWRVEHLLPVTLERKASKRSMSRSTGSLASKVFCHWGFLP